MPPPYPVLLFTGQRIIDEAHQITGKVVERISHATLESLTAKPVDDIVQALYDEHYIHLPVLDRNGAEHEEFEFFYAPYLTMIHNLDFKTLTDQRRGTIFALDVPFTGEARYLRTRPTAIALKAPLGFVGENKVTLYVPKPQKKRGHYNHDAGPLPRGIDHRSRFPQDFLRPEIRNGPVRYPSGHINLRPYLASASCGQTCRVK